VSINFIGFFLTVLFVFSISIQDRLTVFVLSGNLALFHVRRLSTKSGRSSVVERLLAKQKVVGSNPIVRSRYTPGTNLPERKDSMETDWRGTQVA
jgi:hypothetical protein